MSSGGSCVVPVRSRWPGDRTSGPEVRARPSTRVAESGRGPPRVRRSDHDGLAPDEPALRLDDPGVEPADLRRGRARRPGARAVPARSGARAGVSPLSRDGGAGAVADGPGPSPGREPGAG